MGFHEAKSHLEACGVSERIMEFETSSATVELAANAVGCIPARIAKTLAFWVDETPVLIVAAGDAKVASGPFKAFFKTKATMLKPDELPLHVGHEMGGVCPFGVKDGVKIYLDISLKRFESIFPACGSAQSAVEFNPEELQKYAHNATWIDVCKAWER